jgi:hypothetical protein
MRYKYVGGEEGDQWFQGLPARDLDDATLTSEHANLLAVAVEKGIYQVVERGKASVKPGTKDQEAEPRKAQETSDQPKAEGD